MLIDISQPLFSCSVFPGDPAPEKRTLDSLKTGGVCNLTAFSMCAHNGTHVDAPLHFIDGGAGIGAVGLLPFVGPCFVARHAGDLGGAGAEEILLAARAAGAGERILLAGDLTVTAEAAAVFAGAGIRLLGNESQTVGPPEAPADVHRILLGAGVCLLEGIRLENAPSGRSFLSAAPLDLGEADGAPCRAYLIAEETEKGGGGLG